MSEVDQKAREVFRAAAEFYETGGEWGQGVSTHRPNTYCLSEALSFILNGSGWGPEVQAHAHFLFRKKIKLGVVLFNDMTTTTKDHIIRVCKEIAAE